MMRETKIAIETALAASEYLKKCLYSKKQESLKKGSGFQDIVTDVDYQTEEKIIQSIHRAYPNHGILSEETSSALNPQKHKHLWVVDPIDGTIAFAAGLPYYAVSIAYLKDQQQVSSALYLALTDEVLWAETGKGAFIQKRQIKIRELPWEKCIIAFDPGNLRRKDAMSVIAPPLSAGIRFLQITSGEAGNLGLVARGNIQGLVCILPEVWDYAAGIHLVQEAGGVVSDLKGKPYSMFSTSGHIAACPMAHRKIIEYTNRF